MALASLRAGSATPEATKTTFAPSGRCGTSVNRRPKFWTPIPQLRGINIAGRMTAWGSDCRYAVQSQRCMAARLGFPCAGGGAPQAEIFAQGLAGVVLLKQDAPLQFRHDVADEIG